MRSVLKSGQSQNRLSVLLRYKMRDRKTRKPVYHLAIHEEKLGKIEISIRSSEAALWIAVVVHW
jgi:hypothetical protein